MSEEYDYGMVDLLTHIFRDSHQDIANNLNEYIDHYMKIYNRIHESHVNTFLSGHKFNGETTLYRFVFTRKDFDYLKNTSKKVQVFFNDVPISGLFKDFLEFYRDKHNYIQPLLDFGYKVATVTEYDDHIEIVGNA